MVQDILNQTVKKIFNDKILLGLLIVCLLGVFVGGFNHRQEAQSLKDAQMQGMPGNGSENKASNYSADNHLQPDLAVAFVKWWLKAAMDYTPGSAIQSHQAAANWMTVDATKCFDEAFWSADIVQQVAAGTTMGAFQPVVVQALAINPDNSVVVRLSGSLVLQMGNRPMTHQVEMDILVRRASNGLRVAGIYNRLTSLSSSVY